MYIRILRSQDCKSGKYVIGVTYQIDEGNPHQVKDANTMIDRGFAEKLTGEELKVAVKEAEAAAAKEAEALAAAEAEAEAAVEVEATVEADVVADAGAKPQKKAGS